MSVLIPIAAGTAGVATHLLYFHHGEHHLYAIRYIQALLLLFVTAVVSLTHYGGLPMDQSFKITGSITGYFLLGLYTSLIIYRLFFNPLNKFPGPFLARLTTFDIVFRSAKNFDTNKQLLRLHQKYGKFIRIGPTNMSITEPEGVQIISGANSVCKKSPWYDADTPFTSMHTTRNRAMHDRRRRIWIPAFSDKALRGYENRVKKYNDLLVQQISAFSGQPINVTKWFNLYSFDVMGDLAFGKSYKMLESGEKHWSLQLLGEGMDPIGFQLPIWFFRILITIPGAANGFLKFIKYCSEQLEERMKVDKSRDPDIMATLLEHYQRQGVEEKKVELPMLQGDSRLIIVAGSDTTAATLAHLFYHLAKDPEIVRKLREEVGPMMAVDGAVSHAKIADAEYLNGVINETLRLHPPVPSGVFRDSPKEGVWIKGTFVPGNTTIRMPGYAMARDEDIYTDCMSFVPERWFSRPEMTKNKDAFAPFSIGPMGCIGKNLALMEVRLVTAQLVTLFDVSFAAGEEGERLLEKTTDHFTLGLGDLDLVLRRR